MDLSEDRVPAQRESAEPTDFASRLRWIVSADYADEGLSACLPLLALAAVLDAAAGALRAGEALRVAMAELERYR